MTERVHGHVYPGEFLTGKMDFFTIQTTKDIRPTGIANDMNDDKFHTGEVDIYIDGPVFPYTMNGVTYNDIDEYNIGRAAQRRFDVLNQTISIRAQPIIIGDVSTDAAVTPPVPDLPAAGGAGDDDVTVYTYSFATEHTMAWDAEDLAVALDGVEGFIYSLGDTSDNNVSVKREFRLRR